MLFCAEQQSQLHTTRLHNYTFDSDIKIIIINKIKNADTHVFDGVHERRHAILVRLVDVGAELDQILRRVETLLADRQNERRDLRGTCAQCQPHTRASVVRILRAAGKQSYKSAYLLTTKSHRNLQGVHCEPVASK